MLPIIIREAVAEDMEVLLDFEQQVIEYERPFDPALKEEKITYYDMKALMQSPKARLVVGILNGEIIATGYARIEQSEYFIRSREYGYVGFMYVKPNYRGQGINQQILEDLRNWNKAHNLGELRLDDYVQNSSAIKAYEKSGFKKSLVKMRMPL